MNEHAEETIAHLAEWAVDLRNAVLRSHHRIGLVISGDESWCKNVANAILSAVDLHDALWVTDARSSSRLSMPAARVKTLLGQDIDAVVFNAWSRFDPDAFAAVSGAINGGGFLLLLTPVLEDWPAYPDSDKPRVGVHSLSAKQARGRYLTRLVQHIRESSGVLRIEQGGKLPVFQADTALDTANLKAGECRTTDQWEAVQAIEKVALGRRRRPLVLISDRGRGKTSSLGIAAAHLLRKGLIKIIITAPRYLTAELVFVQIKRLLPEAGFSKGLIVYRDSKIRFLPPDELSLRLPLADLVCVDEAAAIPAPLLEKMLRRYARIVFASTVHGYEGSGRGFAIRFKKILDQYTPNWKSQQLKTPIRWSDNDPLEAFISRSMLLDASTSSQRISATFKASDCTIERLDRDSLVNDERTLRQLFGLLVQAHYRTRPGDLRHLLDAPNISVYAASREGHIYATALVATEGGLDDVISGQVFAGKRRLQGHLLPQTLIAQGGFSQVGGLRCRRILRIAVDPRVQRHGLGSALLGTVIKESQKNGFDYVGASFSVVPGILHFWRSSNFEPVLIGMTKNAASAAHSVVVLQGLSGKGKELYKKACLRFMHTFPHWLSDPLRDLDAEIAHELLLYPGAPCFSSKLTKRDHQDLQSFAEGQRGYEVNILPIWRLVSASLPCQDMSYRLSSLERSVLIIKVLQKHRWSEVAEQTGLNGRAAVTATLRDAIRKILEIYTHHV